MKTVKDYYNQAQKLKIMQNSMKVIDEQIMQAMIENQGQLVYQITEELGEEEINKIIKIYREKGFEVEQKNPQKLIIKWRIRITR